MQRRSALALGSGAALLAATGALGVASRTSDEAYSAVMAARRAPLPREAELRDAIRYATLAASSHNTQPWHFRVAQRSIHILPDLSRRTPVVDPDDHHLFASLGCAAANLELAAAASGHAGEARFEGSSDGRIVFDFVPASPQASALCDAIPHRQSTRAPYDSNPVSAAALHQLERAARVPGVELVLLTERAPIDRVRDLVIAGNSVQMADPAFVAELQRWMRFNPRTALQHGDGLYSAASGNPALPSWLGERLFRWVFRANTENDKYARHIDSSAGVAVFVGQRADAEHWMRVGQACQRFALQATALGLKHAFINQPVKVAAMQGELAALIGVPGRRLDLVMRFGYGPTLPMSPRRPVEAVMTL